MNKYGIALAADSALTLGDGEKIYHHAKKLFDLKPGIPVGVMVYGSAEIMGMPWEIVIKQYALTLGEKQFDRLEQYAENFFRFTEGAHSLFPEATQREWFRDTVGDYWDREIIQPLTRKLKRLGRSTTQKNISALAHILSKENSAWERHPRLHRLDDAHGERILATYGPILEKLESHLFSHVALTQELLHKLRLTVKHMYTREWFAPDCQSGIVFAGMGETEPFPAILQYNIGSVAAGVLHYSLEDRAAISREDSAIVVPFAQVDMINMFYRGIDDDLEQKLEGLVGKTIALELGKTSNRMSDNQIERIKKQFSKALNQEIDRKYEAPLIASVEALPRHDLAKMAEALINLTVLKRRMSVDQRETVGGQVDVAILAKGEGFVWVKSGSSQNR